MMNMIYIYIYIYIDIYVHTVDGRNPSAVGRWIIPLWGFNSSRWCRISSIHSPQYVYIYISWVLHIVAYTINNDKLLNVVNIKTLVGFIGDLLAENNHFMGID